MSASTLMTINHQNARLGPFKKRLLALVVPAMRICAQGSVAGGFINWEWVIKERSPLWPNGLDQV
jgi:hypothetical protein